MEDVLWQNLSKKERRKLKKEEKQQEQKQEAKKGRLIKWGFFLVTLALVGVSFFLFKQWSEKRYENAPKIEVAPAVYDFGRISAAQGVVETSFEVKNTGSSPLLISGMETSCGCTTVKLKAKDKESPIFGLHSNPTDWSVSLEAGEGAELVAIFDPNFHETRGAVTRTVSIFSNDPGKKEIKMTFSVNVSP